MLKEEWYGLNYAKKYYPIDSLSHIGNGGIRRKGFKP